MATLIEPVTTTIGAQVTGVDLTGTLTLDMAAEIRAALVRHKVLVFRGQELTPTSHRAFAAT